MSDEYGYSKSDAEGGGSGSSAKPRGTYTGVISRATTKTDKNKLVYLSFGVSITRGKHKKQLVFENYLPLSNKANKFQVARRNSFLRAVGADAGTIPPGAPGGPAASVLNGTIIDVTLEHEFEDVPGEQYSLNTSSSPKQPWKADGWEDKLDSRGRLARDRNDDIIKDDQGEPAPIEPRESLTFYNLSDDYDGLGSEAEAAGSSPAPKADEAADDEDGWG
jgi:hypothetical protein